MPVPKWYRHKTDNAWTKLTDCFWTNQAVNNNEAARALRTAFDIRMEYAHLGLTESHDSLQQMMNLINMLLLAKDVDNAKIVLE